MTAPSFPTALHLPHLLPVRKLNRCSVWTSNAIWSFFSSKLALILNYLPCALNFCISLCVYYGFVQFMKVCLDFLVLFAFPRKLYNQLGNFHQNTCWDFAWDCFESIALRSCAFFGSIDSTAFDMQLKIVYFEKLHFLIFHLLVCGNIIAFSSLMLND